MFEYTIDCYDQETPGFGPPVHVIQVVVAANTDDEAIEKAKKIRPRQSQSIVKIKELNGNLQKTMTTTTFNGPPNKTQTFNGPPKLPKPNSSPLLNGKKTKKG